MLEWFDLAQCVGLLAHTYSIQFRLLLEDNNYFHSLAWKNVAINLKFHLPLVRQKASHGNCSHGIGYSDVSCMHLLCVGLFAHAARYSTKAQEEMARKEIEISL
jgi:hypothetical protein